MVWKDKWKEVRVWKEEMWIVFYIIFLFWEGFLVNVLFVCLCSLVVVEIGIFFLGLLWEKCLYI